MQQIFLLNKILAEKNERITNVVFMGMGEPLANYASVMQAVRILHDPKCFNIGARKITISTVGVPTKMRELANENLPLNLAISLHAPSESLRKQLIPWAEHFALEDILEAARYYFEQTGREITLEYILLQDVNDKPEHARQLAGVCRTLRANVNLIRYNEVNGLPFIRPKAEAVMRFQMILRENGVERPYPQKPRARYRRRLRTAPPERKTGPDHRRKVDRELELYPENQCEPVGFGQRYYRSRFAVDAIPSCAARMKP